jgi:hypothetical protein
VNPTATFIDLDVAEGVVLEPWSARTGRPASSSEAGTRMRSCSHLTGTPLVDDAAELAGG